VDIQFSSHNIPYDDAHNFMRNHVHDIRENLKPEMIWFLEHQPVITLGTGYKDTLMPSENTIPVRTTGRGGKATYHGPGQRVVYAMIDLRTRKISISEYMNRLQNWVVKSLNHIGIPSYPLRDPLGVWINIHNTPHKIAAFGVRVSRGVAWHGLAVNVSTDLSLFQSFSPCGLSSQEYGVTSLEDISKKLKLPPQSMDTLDQSMLNNLPFNTSSIRSAI
jgi:lipoyl(octanoyl) transferase